MRDEEFLAEAVKRGFLKQDQVAALQKTKQEIAAKGLSIDMAQIVVMKGVLNNGQVDQIKNANKTKAMVFGPYEIQQKIGEGGMGVVYKAVKTEAPDKPIALKIVHQRVLTDESSALRFKREAQILVQMDHPNIVKGYEWGEINGRQYISMELLDGKPLSQIIRERRALEEKTVLKVGLDVARALEFVQSHGLVYRDIKPENIILTESGTCKLLDLGLAKTAGSQAEQMQVTAAGMTVGTPVYMSPEHMRGEKDLDIRTDIYGLGATLFHALTGAKPFEGDGPFDIMKKKMEDAAPDPRKRRKDVSDNIAIMIMAMMAKDRKKRYQTPTEVVNDLKLVLQGEAPSRRIEAVKAGTPKPAARPVQSADRLVMPAVKKEKGKPSRLRTVLLVTLVVVAALAAGIFFGKKLGL